MNWRKWLYGLAAAVIGGGASSVTAGFSASIVDPSSFNLHGGFRHTMELMGMTFVVSGFLHAVGYLSQSPLPTMLATTTITSETVSVTQKPIDAEPKV